MSALDRLQNYLKTANQRALQSVPCVSDHKELDAEVVTLTTWLGSSGSGNPPGDLVADALRRFQQTAALPSFRDARLVCFGVADPVGPNRYRLIEDGRRFPSLLECVDDWRAEPRPYRRCYKGLLSGYFSYDYEKGQGDGATNWVSLRKYLSERIEDIDGPGLKPDWVTVLQGHRNLLSEDPCQRYGLALLTGRTEEFEAARLKLEIGEASWLTRRLILAQVHAATASADREFKGHLPRLFELLLQHPLAQTPGLVLLLDRYMAMRPVVMHAGLRDFAVASWGNPWLQSKRASWGLVSDAARETVADWLKLELLQQFFSVLAEDGTNDRRRLNFWQKYRGCIDQMFFALGNHAQYNTNRDFVDLRKKMVGLTLHLYAAGPPTNNAFILCMGNYVVVEFGLKGNAAFIFHKDRLPFKLSGHVAGNTEELKHESNLHRLLHHDRSGDTWEERFEWTLRKHLGIVPSQESTTPRVTSAQPTQPLETARTAAVEQSGSSRAELDALCRANGLRIEDLTSKSGNLWVFGETDEDTRRYLVRWGFQYKAGKGWWRSGG